MKKVGFILFSALLLMNIGYAQSVIKQKMEFTYNQLPLIPLSADKTYSVKIVLTYAEDIVDEENAINEENEARKEEAKEEKEEWEEKSFGEKLGNKMLLGEYGPSGRADLIDQPFYPTIWDKDALASKYVSIPGLTRNDEAKAVIKIYLERFTYELTEKYFESKGYYYYVKGRLPVIMEVFNENGEQVANEDFTPPAFTSRVEYRSKDFKTESDRSAHWRSKRDGILRNIEQKKLDTNMKKLSAFLEESFGYNTPAYKTTFYMVKEGKYTYPEINATYEKAVEAYNLLATSSKDEAFTMLNEINEVWVNALKELDTKNKKARINEKVGQGLYFNLIESNIWLTNFSEAQKYIAKYKIMDPKGNSKTLKNLQELLDDEKARFDVNSAIIH